MRAFFCCSLWLIMYPGIKWGYIIYILHCMVFRVSKLLEIALFFVLNLFIYLKNYLCDCSRSLIFIMACGIFRSSLWTLSCSMWIPVAPCGIQSPDQGLNPAPTLHWGLSVLATGPPRKSLGISLLLCNLWGQTNFPHFRSSRRWWF